jgi:hypothetical protein
MVRLGLPACLHVTMAACHHGCNDTKPARFLPSCRHWMVADMASMGGGGGSKGKKTWAAGTGYGGHTGGLTAKDRQAISVSCGAAAALLADCLGQTTANLLSGHCRCCARACMCWAWKCITCACLCQMWEQLLPQAMHGALVASQVMQATALPQSVPP